MRTIKRAVTLFGKMIGLILGGDFRTAMDFEARNHPYLAFGC